MNNLIQFINNYNDNIFINKLAFFFKWIKNLLDSLSEWLGNIINKDINSKNVSDVNSKSTEIIENKIESVDYDYINEYNLRKEYSNPQEIEVKNDNYKWIKYTIEITGIILVIGILKCFANEKSRWSPQGTPIIAPVP